MPEKKPSIYIPTLYFIEGLPYTMVNTMSVVFFKSLKASNEFIGLTSLLYIPWTIKLLWAPLVDIYGSKRSWIINSQFVLFALAALLAVLTNGPNAIALSLAAFAMIALASATQDVAIDGYYMDALDKDKQAAFIGVRNTFYKVAILLGSGGLVYLAGKIAQGSPITLGWSFTFAVCAMVFLASGLFHSFYLPAPKTQKAHESLTLPVFLRVFSTYFQQKAIVPIVLYILMFRLGDALMLKMAQPFLMDPASKGGLSITVEQVGLIYGTIGTIFLMAGSILGGILIARDGLKYWLWRMALLQNSAIILYWLLALGRPGIWWVACVNAAEQFSYGMGVAAYTVFLLATIKSEFKAAHYATATALMALGMMLPGAVSGFLAEAVGYADFFLISFLASLPGWITIFFLPVPDKVTSDKEVAPQTMATRAE